MIAFWIILTGALVAISCGLLGSFLVLRKMSMVGDAISHAVLPGIVIAFLWSGSRDTLPMLLGAGATGLLATFIIEYLHRKARLQTDASIGIVFTFMFAVGIILISTFAGKIDLDQDCVLYGELAYVPINLWILPDGTSIGPKPVYILSVVLLLVILFIYFGYKELKLTSFDPSFASAIGISTALWHYLLMAAVSFTTVSAFESVGAILVITFLIGPPATAYLLTENLKKMLFITVGIGILVSFTGYWLAYWLNASIAGCMALMTGVVFAVVFVYTKFVVKYKKRKLIENELSQLQESNV
ncbi:MULTISPECIES: metal ABC transporter permease [Bacteroidota]|jgi:manganese/zinc/iron transport system permease protein|uniref:Manganese/zinc/iron transport system permease protein n=1 Tax=Sphingobacterium psychroaquaticum TaxID=561061 RepID=A0A1X7J991_9SPHI|nr:MULTISPECIES: metal ABC transporter permease [Bacteroidota]KFF20016.1 iron ABC transporter [Chryseobacterium sp. JM1]MDV3779360.1 metal ABC transporter permease [Elizabethkingia anophelis]MDV3792834.1 metal ABC transporter permease [Elizabethkingia anophelis]MDV3812599.1 metal ABC transporter permease [Elizabethkingia anophelis]MDV3822391.1 metal ABC transporter permease [Elizabethkingia anophelis]